jgi:glycosyltransferase involved in cell wall biosynthesis
MKTSKISVLYITNIPSPYMVDFFNLLGKKIKLHVVFEKGISTERNSSWRKYNFVNFKASILKGFSTSADSSFSLGVVCLLFKVYDFVFISNPTTPTGILSLLILKLFKRKYIILSEGAYPNSNNNLKEFIKKFILNKAWYYFSGNPSNDRYFLKYNKNANIIRFPFSSIHKNEIISLKDKYLLKKRLIKSMKFDNFSKICLMVGRFIKLKNFISVINSWKFMPSEFLLVIVGEGPEEKNYLKMIEKNQLKNVKVVPFQKKLELKKYYLISDLLLHPTTYDVWGLIINEAFSNALPVFTTPSCLAAEVMITDSINGYRIDFSKSDNINLIKETLDNQDKLDFLSHNALKTARNFTLEKMVQVHLAFIKKKFFK